jgi:hypothetical protein
VRAVVFIVLKVMYYGHELHTPKKCDTLIGQAVNHKERLIVCLNWKRKFCYYEIRLRAPK